MIEDFINKYRGKKVEVWDSSQSGYAQCLDLVLKWIETQGHGNLIPLGVLNAYELWTKTPSKLLKYYDKIPNTINEIPRGGDIIVWGKSFNGTAGHTGIATNRAGQYNFDAFVQNDPVGMYSVVKRYTYAHVLGWLRLKSSQQPMNDLQKKLDKYFNQKVTADFVIKWADDRKAEIDRLNKAITEKDKKLKDLQDAIGESNKDIKDLNNLIKKKNAELDRLEKDIVAVKTGLRARLAQQKTDCQRQLEKSKEEYLIDLKREKENFKLIKDGLEEEIRKLKQGQVKPPKPREGFHKWVVDLLDALFGYDN